MSRRPAVRIVGTGHYVPPKVLTNQDLEQIMETSDEWITDRTGIRERRIAADGEGAADMGSEAARRALADAGVEPEEIDLLVVSTATPDRLLPSTACDIQAVLETSNAMAFDVSAACSGWLYGLTMAEGYLRSGLGRTALVVATEKMSSIIDWQDRATCVLFGDGAGAAVVRPSEDGRGILSTYHRSDGKLGDLLYRPGGGARHPMDREILENREHLVRMSGREVFKNAVRCMTEAAEQALERAGLTGEDIDIMVPHQANLRIIEATSRYSRIPMEKVFVNLDRYGNMSSASVPVAIDEAVRGGRIQPGMDVLAVTFGAGFTWGAMTFRW